MRSFLSIGCLVLAAAATHAQECKELTTVEDFDINAYASAKWYVQQQMEIVYLPKEENNCVTAEYTVKDKPTFWGYTVGVYNSAQDADGDENGGDLCAIVDPDYDVASKLAVAPCFFPPRWFAGPYWVVGYDEAEGWALVSGGQPDKPTQDGLCATGRGWNDSGLWIFTRAQERDEELVNKVRAFAEDAGIDTSVLNDVDQSNCDEAERNVASLYLRRK